MAEPDPMRTFADTIRVDGWCLRSALVRYAQAEAARSTVVHGQLRRLDAALADADAARREELRPTVERLSALADAMSAWAADRRAHPIPTPLVDDVVAAVATDFERLAVPEEAIDPAEWRGMRSSEGRRAPRAKKVSAD